MKIDETVVATGALPKLRPVASLGWKEGVAGAKIVGASRPLMRARQVLPPPRPPPTSPRQQFACLSMENLQAADVLSLCPARVSCMHTVLLFVVCVGSSSACLCVL